MEENERQLRLTVAFEGEGGGGGVVTEPGALMSEQAIDGRVIKACQEGDREAFRLLFEAYQDRAYSIAYHFSGDEAMAKDMTQQVFLKLFTSIRQFRHDAEFTTWLYRLVVNVCLDEHRRRRRFVPFGEAPERSHGVARRPVEEHYRRRELAGEVQAAIAELKPKLRIAILLKYFEELSYDEMAQVLGCSPGTVASRLNRGHRMLAEKLAHLRGALYAGE
jgi:RNA polymerase sigma-70 factor, ECF subfamily